MILCQLRPNYKRLQGKMLMKLDEIFFFQVKTLNNIHTPRCCKSFYNFQGNLTFGDFYLMGKRFRHTLVNRWIDRQTGLKSYLLKPTVYYIVFFSKTVKYYRFLPRIFINSILQENWGQG